MVSLLTTLCFFGLTALCMVLHARRTRSTRHTAARSEMPPCPRCGARVATEVALCPGCGVPLQAYEIVAAPAVAAGKAAGAPAAPDPTQPAHAVIRSDACVGCGTCVAACPEPGAIRLEHKIAVVNLDLCKGHGACAAACPMSAIIVTSGAAVQHVAVPAVNANFESNVPGIYVVGELGGRGLIKNAINEGKIAAEHVARVLGHDQSRTRRPDGIHDVVIVGSGPAGLSAGLEATRAGLRSLILEQGSLSDSIRKYPRKKLLLAEPVRVPLYGSLWVADASKEELLQIWETIIANAKLDVRCGQRVENVVRTGGVFQVTAGDRSYRARKVVLAMGRRGTPRRLGVPGEEFDKVFYDIVEMETFAGARVLVVGGGDSAIESALGLANQQGTTVILSYRGTGFTRVKERNRAKLAAAVERGTVALRLESQLREIRVDSVIIEQSGILHNLPNDFVIVRIGGEAPYPFLERIGVQIIGKEIALPAAEPAGATAGADAA